METAEHNNASSSRSYGMTATVVIAVMLIFGYPLSLGPAAWLYEHTSDSNLQNTLRITYSPLFWTSNGLGVADAVQRYCDHWVD